MSPTGESILQIVVAYCLDLEGEPEPPNMIASTCYAVPNVPMISPLWQ
jgi:hypothetical protein